MKDFKKIAMALFLGIGLSTSVTVFATNALPSAVDSSSNNYDNGQGSTQTGISTTVAASSSDQLSNVPSFGGCSNCNGCGICNGSYQ